MGVIHYQIFCNYILHNCSLGHNFTCTYCQGKVDESAYKILTDYQTATVTFLALLSAATGDVSKYASFFSESACFIAIFLCSCTRRKLLPLSCPFSLYFFGLVNAHILSRNVKIA